MNNNNVLVVGAGIAGIEASLVLAQAGKSVHLVEREMCIGGNVIKYEDVFSNLECATCMIAPKQQELLANENITLLTLSEVTRVEGSKGDFTVSIKQKARYVSMEACIGCNACFDPCPVSLKNEFEENLCERKAIYTPCPGALPNVPRIDTDACLRFKGEDCNLCKEACMFEAIEYDQKDEDITLNVGEIILATGFRPLDPSKIPHYGYGNEDVYSAFEFERMYASNGPTQGNLVLKDGKTPSSAAVIFGVGVDDYRCPSSICTMYSLKYIYYLRHKLPEIKIAEFYREICVPCKSCGDFLRKMQETGSEFIRVEDIKVTDKKGSKEIVYKIEGGDEKTFTADMVIVASPMRPGNDAEKIAGIFGIPQLSDGFFAKQKDDISSVISGKDGIYIIGCAGGPKNIGESITEAQAAAGRILSLSYQTSGQ
ncbi:MAG: CoB--CoM heterodisulfide reductase iron-sulfur subunit A family protein [Spirochaetales bacterium]|nr:CoB--CoM heterodisulfide reductase iron-sulfur subunit A family protein [Spirochaetales bacterium]